MIPFPRPFCRRGGYPFSSLASFALKVVSSCVTKTSGVSPCARANPTPPKSKTFYQSLFCSPGVQLFSYCLSKSISSQLALCRFCQPPSHCQLHAFRILSSNSIPSQCLGSSANCAPKQLFCKQNINPCYVVSQHTEPSAHRFLLLAATFEGGRGRRGRIPLHSASLLFFLSCGACVACLYPASLLC